MSEDDPRYGMHPKPMGTSQTPVFYRDKIVDMMINVMKTTNDRDITKDGVYGALELIKRIQYGKWFHEKDEAKRAKIILDPIEVANLAILNCRPVMELRKMTKLGTVYQVPFSISEEKATFRALKMMRQLLAQKKRQKRKMKPFKTRLAHELLEAMQGEGLTVQAKQELHRLCEQNRAYSSMRHF